MDLYGDLEFDETQKVSYDEVSTCTLSIWMGQSDVSQTKVPNLINN